MEPIPFHVPSLDEEDIPGVLEVLRTGWLTTGSQCREFEARFADYLSAEQPLHCIAVNSGTAALHLGLEAVGVRPGHKVLTTPFTFTATAEVVRYLGADPVFVDVEEHDFSVAPRRYREAWEGMDEPSRAQVKAIIPVHYGGMPGAMEELEAFAQDTEIAIVDDAAHALPARRQGRMIGNFGDATAFSFYATKTLCTGEGGMVVTRNADLAKRMRTMRLHGISHDVFDRYRDDKPSWYYEVIAPGYKYNMGDIAAALGLSQLKRVDVFHRSRVDVATRYREGLATVDGVIVPPDAPKGDEHSWHLFALRVLGGRALRDAFITELAAMGIATSVHFIPLHLQPYYRDKYNLEPEDFPVSTKLFEQEVSLPIYIGLSEAQIDRVIESVPVALASARAASASDSNG